MTNLFTKGILSCLTLVPLLLPLPSEAQGRVDPTGQTLRSQQEQIQELNRQLQVQTNQREIERLQNQLSGNQNQNQQPQVVVVEQNRGPSDGAVILGGLLNGVLSNGYVDCGPRGNCAYGFGRGGYGYGGGGYYANDRRCSWGSGYQGCYQRKPNSLSISAPPPISASGFRESLRETEAGLNNVIPPQKPVNEAERILGNVNVDCGHWDGSCSAGYAGFHW